MGVSRELLATMDAEHESMAAALAETRSAVGARFFAWLLDGASREEREAVTREVPGPVVSIIGGIFGRGYRKDVAPVWRV